jgi:hypothetical protein
VAGERVPEISKPRPGVECGIAELERDCPDGPLPEKPAGSVKNRQFMTLDVELDQIYPSETLPVREAIRRRDRNQFTLLGRRADAEVVQPASME